MTKDTYTCSKRFESRSANCTFKSKFQGPISTKFPNPVESPPGPPWSHMIKGLFLFGDSCNHQKVCARGRTSVNPHRCRSPGKARKVVYFMTFGRARLPSATESLE